MYFLPYTLPYSFIPVSDSCIYLIGAFTFNAVMVQGDYLTTFQDFIVHPAGVVTGDCGSVVYY